MPSTTMSLWCVVTRVQMSDYTVVGGKASVIVLGTMMGAFQECVGTGSCALRDNPTTRFLCRWCDPQ